MAKLTIGRLAAAAGVHLETVRYYERRGLMPEPERAVNGYRVYRWEDIARLRFIKHAQELGFRLGEIEELLALQAESQRSCADVKRKTQEKIAWIDTKIKGLMEMKRTLIRLSEQCTGSGVTERCPILRGINDLESNSWKEEKKGE